MMSGTMMNISRYVSSDYSTTYDRLILEGGGGGLGVFRGVCHLLSTNLAVIINDAWDYAEYFPLGFIWLLHHLC